MAEYIDREDLAKHLDILYNRLCGKSPNFHCGFLTAVAYVKEFSEADVKPVVHGRWIEYPVAHYYKCSECRYTVPYRKAALMSGKRQYNYCPSCGAKMDSEE